MHKTHINLMDSTEFEQLQFDLQALQPFLQLTDDGLLSLIEYCFSDVSVTPCFITTGACNFGVRPPPQLVHLGNAFMVLPPFDFHFCTTWPRRTGGAKRRPSAAEWLNLGYPYNYLRY